MLAEGIGSAKRCELLDDAGGSGGSAFRVVHLPDDELAVVGAGGECMIVDGPLHGAHVQARGAFLGSIGSIAECSGGADEGLRADENDGGRVEQVDERGDGASERFSGAVEDVVDDAP
ncbi:hypothetical protein ACRJ4W_35670 [Streptomyces sp. GLT-R25]